MFYAPQEGLGRHQGSGSTPGIEAQAHPLEVEMSKPEVSPGASP